MTLTDPTATTDEAVDVSDRTAVASGDLSTQAPSDEVVDEVLVEEISIDGMCGVY